MVFLKVIGSFVDGFRNYDSFKFFFENFLEFLKKKKNTVILKILKILEKSNGRFIVKYLKFLLSHSVKRNRS